jgi:hypothetical protein
MDYQELDSLSSKLKAEQGHLSEAICAGRVADYAEYKRLCGVIHGLDIALGVIADQVKRLETDDE